MCVCLWHHEKFYVLLKVIKLLSPIKIAFPISYKIKFTSRKCGWSHNFHAFGVHYYMIQYMGLPNASSSFKNFFLFLIILLINKSCWIYIKLCTQQLLLQTIVVLLMNILKFFMVKSQNFIQNHWTHDDRRGLVPYLIGRSHYFD